jgi:hypothetical protein
VSRSLEAVLGVHVGQVVEEQVVALSERFGALFPASQANLMPGYTSEVL